MNFHEAGSGDHREGDGNGGVVALDVAHSDPLPAPARESEQVVRLGQRRGDGLLDQHVEAGIEEPGGNFRMTGSRRRDDGGLRGACHGLQRGQNRKPELPSDLLRPTLVVIVNAYALNPGKRCGNSRRMARKF